MKVRILSGNETGTIKDLPQIEAENAMSTGFAEAYVEPPKETRAEKAKREQAEEDAAAAAKRAEHKRR